VLIALLLAGGLLASPQQPEQIADVQVHGNTLTPDVEIVRLAGVEVGMPVDDALLAQAAARLRATHRFDRVDVLKRFASIADPSRIAVVIVVDEGPVAIRSDGRDDAGGGGPPTIARVVKRRGIGLMFLPILDYEDGYGFSYGVRFGAPHVIGRGSRLSVPLSWGGEKRAGATFDQELGTAITRLQVGTEFVRRKNPYFQEHDDRGKVWARGERELGRRLRVGAAAEWQHASFLGLSDHLVRTGADVVLDTRIDPLLPRNAVYARAAWDHLAFGAAPDANRTELDVRGYAGLIGQAVLVVRGQRQNADRPLPPYLSPLLGGTSNLRGFRAGSAIGDTLVASSAELRVPLTSPLRIAKLGVSAFVDAATVYDDGQRLRDRPFERGFGGGVWMSAAFFRVDLYAAHGVGRSTRLHVGTSVSF
jgi:outer membrane protein assembly factor BamA